MVNMTTEVERVIGDLKEVVRQQLEEALDAVAKEVLNREFMQAGTDHRPRIVAKPQPKGKWMTRQEIVEEFGVEYHVVVYAQKKGYLPSEHKGNKVVSERRAVEKYFMEEVVDVP